MMIVFIFAGILPAGCRDEPGGGEAIYAKHCASCHGPDAEGLRALYPPLRGSTYLEGRLPELPCLLKTGVRSTGSGAGKGRMVMPSFTHLSSGEMTDLVRYLLVSWGGGTNAPSVEDVESWAHQCR